MRYFFPLTLLMLAVFGALALYKHNGALWTGTQFLASSIDSIFSRSVLPPR